MMDIRVGDTVILDDVLALVVGVESLTYRHGGDAGLGLDVIEPDGLRARVWSKMYPDMEVVR